MDDRASRPFAEGEPTRGSTTGPPRWVKAFGIVGLVAVVAVVVMVLLGGNHGPGRHLPSGDGGQLAPASSVEHSPPEGSH